MAVDFSKEDIYPGNVVPDEDIETALKVLRTLRNIRLHPNCLDTADAATFSHALHAIIDIVQEAERVNADREQQQEQLLRQVFAQAELHAEQACELEMEVGDLQSALRAAVDLLPDDALAEWGNLVTKDILDE